MPRLQEIIHSLEVGAGARYLRIFALLLGVVTMAIFYDLRKFQNLHNEESMDMAQLARNIAEGRGYTTRYVRPVSMGVFMRHREDRDPLVKGEHPDIINAPLYPVFLAAFMKIPGLFNYEIVSPKEGLFRRYQPDLMISMINQGLFFLAVLLTWRLARRAFDNQVALISVLVMLASEKLWEYSVSGQWTMLGLVLTTALANVLFEMDQSTSATPEPRLKSGALVSLAILAGILCALLGLTRYSLAVLLIPVLIYLLAAFPRHRVILPAAALISFLVAFTPWLVRNWQLCGNPFGIAGYSLFQDTHVFPLNSLDRTIDPHLSLVGSSEIIRKLFSGARALLSEDLPQLGGSWLSALFVTGLLVPFVQRWRGRLRWFTVGALALLCLAQILGRTHLSTDSPRVNSENLIVLVTPLVLIFGAALVILLVRSMEVPVEAWRSVVLGTVVVVLWVPMLIGFGPPRTQPIAYPPYYPPMVRPLQDWFTSEEWIMSDMPWAVAWYADRQSVLISRTPDKDFMEINDWIKTINGLYLTRLTMDQKFISGWLLNAREWGRFMIDVFHREQVPDGFPTKKAPPFLSTFPHYLLFADRDRWTERMPTRMPRQLDEKEDEEIHRRNPEKNPPSDGSAESITIKEP